MPMTYLLVNCLPLFMKGDAFVVKILEYEYQVGLESWKNNLHGRMVLTKAQEPIKLQDPRSKLTSLWTTLGE